MKQISTHNFPAVNNVTVIELKKKKKKRASCCEKFKKEGKGCCKSCPLNWG